MNVDQIIQYFNYFIIGLLVIGTLLGFMKGLFKSIYNLIVFVALLLIGWFISGPVARGILSYDISRFGLDFFSVNGTQAANFNEYIKLMVMSNVEGLSEASYNASLLAELVNSFAVMLVRVVFIIIWLILMATVLKFIFWIVYMFIKPKKVVDGKRKKKTLFSRLGGMGVSLGHTLLIVLIISVPLAGITSIGSAIGNLVPLTEDADPDPLSYRPLSAVFTNEGIRLLDNGTENEELIQFMESYRETLAGKIAGFAKFKGNHFDEIIFDSMFSFKVNKQRIKIRRELQVIVGVYTTIEKEVGPNEITPESIMEIDEEILDDILKQIASLKLIHIIIPTAAEISVKSTMLEEQLGDISGVVDLEALLVSLKEIDYEDEIYYLGKSALLVLDLMQDIDLEDEEFNYLSLSKVKIHEIADELGESELLDIFSAFALAFVVNGDALEEPLADFGMSPSEIDIEGVTLSTELKSLANIYSAIIDAGFTNFDLELVDLGAITDENLNDLGTAVFSSRLLSNNTKLLAKFLMSSLPDEYLDIIVVNDIDKDDFVSVLGLGVVLVKSGVMDDEFDPLDILTEENIEKIATYISNSNLFTSNIEGILELLLATADLPIELEMVELTWKGPEGKAELIALLTTAKKIVGMMEDEGFDFSRQNIDELADVMVESRIIMHNVGSLLKFLLEEANIIDGYEFLGIDDVVWDSPAGKVEFKALLNAIGILLDSGLTEDFSFDNLSDGRIDPEDDDINELAEALSSSLIIRLNLSNLLDSFMPTEFDLVLLDDPDEWTHAEIRALLMGAKILLGESESFDMYVIIDLSEEDTDILVSSRVIVKNAIIRLTDENANNGSQVVLPPELDPDDPSYDEELWHGVNGELNKAIRGFKKLGVTNFEDDIDFGPVFAEARGDEPEVILASKVIEASMVNKIEEAMAPGGSLEGTLVKPDDFDDEDWYGEDGELRPFLVAVEILIGSDDLGTAIFDVDAVIGPDQETILESRVVEASVIKYVKGSPKLVIPDAGDVATFYYFTDEELIWDRSDVDGVGELRRFLDGVTELIGPNDFASFVFDMDSVLHADFDEILPSRVLEATIAETVMDLISIGGDLEGFIDEPVDGFKWYHHATSSDPVENGTYLLDVGKVQHSDLLGMINAVQKMDSSGVSFHNVDLNAVQNASTDDLSDALWNYSRVVQGSIATLLNKVLDDAGVPSHIYRVDQNDINSQNDVKAALEIIKLI